MIRRLIILLLIVGCKEPAIDGCTVTTACNFNVDAIEDDGSCFYAEQGYSCDGLCLGNDFDEDGICDDDDPYQQGDYIIPGHQNMVFNYCYPADSSTSTFSISKHKGKVFMLDMAASW